MFLDHLTEDLLEAILEGSLPPEKLVERMFRHLTDLCPTCRRRTERFAGKQLEKKAKRSLDFSLLLKTVHRWNKELQNLRKEAQRDRNELLRLEPEERVRRVERALKRFRSPMLAELLLEESRCSFANAPKKALDLATLAGKVALQVNVRIYGFRFAEELVVRANAYKANCHRILGNLRKAEEWIRWPLSKLRDIADPLVLGEVLHLAGSLRRDSNDFDEALKFLAQASQIYGEIDNPALAARTLASKGHVLGMIGRPDEAVAANRQALELIPSSPPSRLYLGARHNVSWYLADAGLYLEAQQAFEANQVLYEIFPEPDFEIRRTWLSGRIAEGLGEIAKAEAAYAETRDRFVAEGRGIDAALASLDLALLYVKQGKTAEIKTLAKEIHVVLRAHDIHREALAALILFQKAAEREALEAGLVREIAGYLERARSNPELAFRRPEKAG